MKFMLVIPTDLAVKTSKRSEQRDAAKRLLVELARNPEEASKFLRSLANSGDFLVRAWERTPATDRVEETPAGTAVTPTIES